MHQRRRAGGIRGNQPAGGVSGARGPWTEHALGRADGAARSLDASPTASERQGTVAAIVLAAGASTRLGRNKLLLEIDGETLVRRAVRNASSAGLDPVIVVLGHEAERALGELSDLHCHPVINPDHLEGIRASLRAGARAIPAEAAAAIVLLADMPLVDRSMLSTLVERHRAGRALAVVSHYGEVEAPPTLYDRALFPELLALEGPGCLRQVARRHRDEAAHVCWPAEALADVDLPGDDDRVRAVLAARHQGTGHAG